MTLGDGILESVADPSLTRADTAAFVGRYKEAKPSHPSWVLTAGSSAPHIASARWTPYQVTPLNIPAAVPPARFSCPGPNPVLLDCFSPALRLAARLPQPRASSAINSASRASPPSH
ncbi:hypothetical protein NDU88_010288 [Pleurodeles waltl]|uniref:Uncharacterized protein n=1 Tax=Pleurodeles waltl TaxID=8319 RepID=A0AAV7QU28_PLEWA|nr:hypothetical protein NDU88_010288 [Pleurodeles waltl]